MNFFGHAVVARWRSQDPRFVLGTMLPDLTAMMGLRLTSATPATDAAVQTGIEHHYATDAAFHNATHFVRLCAESLDELTAAGVERGTARAVGHVGTELLLDGLLSREASELAAYKDALSQAVERRLVDTLGLDPEARARLHAGLVRLQQAPVPEGYREPAFVVDRLQFILERRPRLAIKPSDLPHVSARIRGLLDDVSTIAPELLADVRRRLAP